MSDKTDREDALVLAELSSEPRGFNSILVAILERYFGGPDGSEDP